MLSGLSQLEAQSSNERVKWIRADNDTLLIDSLSIIPGSAALFITDTTIGLHQLLDTGAYHIDYFKALLFLKSPGNYILEFHYRVFPYNLAKEYFNKDPNALDSANINLAPFTMETGKSEPYLNMQGLDYSGSFARGISFGNNQDIVVNSNFNLQMNGMLQNDVKINANITDNNIPLQPEGNTQQLQEFDKIFIQLSKGGQQLTMGDFELYRPKSYFMNYYKKLQGASYTGVFEDVAGGELHTGLSAAVAKGIYARQDIPVLEGDQGPYKLKGNNGETFIIILAGTERVFIDGKLLVRGAENDYVIDYNAGEITFTPNQLLTKDKRVQIEFEYSDKNYFRSLVYSGSEFISGDEKLKLRLNIYSEQDSKNQPIDQTIDSGDRAALEAAGDSISQAYASGVDTIAFDASRILYKMIDSLGFDSVFVYSTNPDSAKYALSFTELGVNEGNYIQSASTANGRVYQWVAPIGGIKQGTAEPVVLLIAPQKSQMITLGGDYQIDKKNLATTELAYSDKDPNTFAESGNSDNQGMAWRGGYQNTNSWHEKTQVVTNVNYEFAGKDFVPLERYRPVEFNRDWNILSEEKTNEHYANAGINLQNEKWNAALQSSAFIRENYYSGFRQSASAGYQSDTWNFSGGGSYLLSTADSLSSQFLRPKAEISRNFPALHNWRIGAGYEGEHNAVSDPADSLTIASYYYDQLNYFLGNADTALNHFYFNVISRDDKLPLNGKFTDVTRGNTYSASGALYKNEKSRLSWQASYRTLEIVDTSLTELTPENSLLGRIQYGLVIKKGLITSDIFYEAGSGQEPKREYTFVEVEPGQGVYTWNDYNNNGVQELNEFEIAVFADEANFIQVFVPTDEYIRSNITNFNYSLAINPKVIWHDKKGVTGFLGKFSAQSSWQTNRKVLDDKSIHAYNPVAAIDDSLLVSSNNYWLNTIYFNRSSPKFGIDYSYLNNFSKQVITIGPESRGKGEHKITLRYKIATPLTFNATYTSGEKIYSSAAFDEKNYTIPYFTIQPKFSFIRSTVFRASVYYEYLQSNNFEGVEDLLRNEFTLDLRYNVVSRSTISSGFSYIKMEFNGIEDSPVGYAMLEGLQNGNNILWDLNFDRRLSQVLQLTISYEGRKTGDAAITHVGKLQMRAVF